MLKNLWNTRRDQSSYALVLALTLLFVFLLPGVVNLAVAKAVGTNPMDAAARIVLKLAATSLGLLVAYGFLALMTRQRLRDLDLPGALLAIVPTAPFIPLWAFVAGSAEAYLITPTSPLIDPLLWLGLLLLAPLAIVPGGPSALSSGPIFSWLREVFDCEGALGLAPFRKRGALLLLGFILLQSVSSVFSILAYSATIKAGAGSPATMIKLLAIKAIGSVATLSNLLLFASFVSLCVRRLHDLGRSAALAAFCPFGLPSVPMFAMMAARPMMIPVLMGSPLVAFQAIWGALSLVTLACLLFARGNGAARPGPNRPSQAVGAPSGL